MMPFPYTSLFAGCYILLFMALSLQVIIHCRRYKAAIGNPHQDALLERKIRVHANFAEYTPFIIVGLLLLEAWSYHYLLMALGFSYLLACTIYCYGLVVAEPNRQNYRWSIAGMMITLFGLLITALTLIANFFLSS